MGSLIDVLLDDPDEGLRAVAADALADLAATGELDAERTEVMDALRTALSDPSAAVQQAASLAIVRVEAASLASGRLSRPRTPSRYHSRDGHPARQPEQREARGDAAAPARHPLQGPPTGRSWDPRRA